ncbi:MAG: 30S ribosomal protein S2 [archaeon]
MTKMEKQEKLEDPLVPIEKYLETGAHIGSKYKTGQMDPFAYKCRNDGLWVLDIAKIDEKLKNAAKLISKQEPSQVLVVSGRKYAEKPAEKMAEKIGATPIIGRYPPGLLTNPRGERFLEPDLVITADPAVDSQAIKEAQTAKVPVISLCDTSNRVENIDLIIPINNKGKQSLALAYYLMARETLKNRGVIKENDEFDAEIEDFQFK